MPIGEVWWESLLFIEFIVFRESKIFKVVDLFCCLAMGGGGIGPVRDVFDVIMSSFFVMCLFRCLY